MPRLTPRLLLLVAILGPAPRLGAEPADRAAPPLALPTDPPPPRTRITLTVDGLAAFFGHYGATLTVAAGDRMSVSFTPTGAKGALALETGWLLWPLGRGLTGLFMGGFAGAVVTAHPADVGAVEVGFEGGAQHVWGGLVLGGALGLASRWDFSGAQAGRALAPRARLHVGWGWM